MSGSALSAGGGVRSSLPFAALLHVNWYFLWLYYPLGVISFAYKDGALPSFPKDLFGLEITTFVLLFIVDQVRLRLGDRGNKTHSVMTMFAFFVADLFAIAFALYFAFLSTYVLYVDSVLNLIALLLSASQFFFGLITVVSSPPHEKVS
jgi:hypothetical protein